MDRFCEAALDPEMGVERILAFTFTERAADQLRRRVRETLAAMAEEAEGERLERIREAEDAAERAWISTIHGFCRRLLASHPAAAGLDPRFRVADEPEADRLAIRAFDAALEDLVAEGGAEALALAAANHKRHADRHDQRRLRRAPQPRADRARAARAAPGRPSRRARRADRGGARGARGVRGGEREGRRPPRPDRRGDGAGSRRRPPTGSCSTGSPG